MNILTCGRNALHYLKWLEVHQCNTIKGNTNHYTENISWIWQDFQSTIKPWVCNSKWKNLEQTNYVQHKKSSTV